MLYIRFMLMVADLQASLGRGVRVIDIQRKSKIPRSTIYRYLNQLIESRVVTKVSRGKYKIVISDEMITLGLCVVSPLDVYLSAHVNHVSETYNVKTS